MINYQQDFITYPLHDAIKPNTSFEMRLCNKSTKAKKLDRLPAGLLVMAGAMEAWVIWNPYQYRLHLCSGEFGGQH